MICESARAAQLARRLCGSFCTRLSYHLLDLSHQSRPVIGDTVLDRPLDSAGVDGLAVSDFVDAGRIKHLQILERIAVHDDEVGCKPRADAAQLLFLAKYPRVVPSRVLNDLERIKPRFLMKLQSSNQTEAVHLIDKPSVFTCADRSA